jgi:replicative DNA helicase
VRKPIEKPDDLKELSLCEESVVGAIMQDPTCFHYIDTKLRGEHFCCEELGKLYDGLLMLHNGGVNISDKQNVGALLKTIKCQSRYSLADISRMIHWSFVHNIRYYADIVITAWRHRQLWKLGVELAERFQLSASIAPTQSDRDDIAFIETRMAALFESGESNSVRCVHEIAHEYLCQLETAKDSQNGVMTGVYPIDNVVGKILPGELCVIAARPGCGKTALALQMAEHVAGDGTVFFVSLEMRDRELVSRTLCRISGITSHELRSGQIRDDAKAMMRDAAKAINGMPLFIWSPYTATIQQIRAKCKHVKAAHNLRMLVVDYIQIVKASNEERGIDRHIQVGNVTRTLKEIAKEFQVPVIALAQLKRDQTNKVPDITMLRESGSIEQDADIVLMLHHVKDTHGAEASYCIIGKHRHGDTGQVTLEWDKQSTSFNLQKRQPKKYEEFETYGDNF